MSCYDICFWKRSPPQHPATKAPMFSASEMHVFSNGPVYVVWQYIYIHTHIHIYILYIFYDYVWHDVMCTYIMYMYIILYVYCSFFLILRSGTSSHAFGTAEDWRGREQRRGQRRGWLGWLLTRAQRILKSYNVGPSVMFVGFVGLDSPHEYYRYAIPYTILQLVINQLRYRSNRSAPNCI